MAVNSPKLNASKIFKEAFNLNAVEEDPTPRPSSASSSIGDPAHLNTRKMRRGVLNDEEYKAFTIFYKTCYPEKFTSLNYESQDKNIIDQKINEMDKQKFKQDYKIWRANNPTNNLTEFAKELCPSPRSGGRRRITKRKRKAKNRNNKRKTRR